ncbi:MAG: SpoIID/LytB domain-containing protein [Gammaproteobacteria bacterium]|nr:SpoIID/LytB domain-containing protein [Gammaproteobacteria bacterium]
MRLRSQRGATLATASGAMRLNAPTGGSLQVSGRALNGISNGSYRGSIELRGSYVINQLTLEDYIRGVVAGEMPSSWPAAALQAQAIAARTYAITTAKSSTFDHYPDTRSQVYRGVAGETASTDEAVRATAGKFVTYDGKPIATYYFSTSGGQTENVEYSWPGANSAPYLKSVQDPWDKVSPVHRWNVKYSRATLQRRLGGWVKGTLRSIAIVKRGVSPRIVHADIVGSRGKTRVTGPQLRARLGLRDTWVQFVFSGAKTKPLPTPSTGGADDDAKPTTPANRGSGSGGVVASRLTPATARALTDATTLGAGMAAGVVASGHVQATGRVWPGGGKKIVRLQRKAGGRWRTVQRVRADERGNWSTLIPAGSVRRVVALGTAGPIIRG